MADSLQQLKAHIEDSLKDEVILASLAYGELTFSIHHEHLIRVLMFLKEDPETRFQSLMDISGADYPERVSRFDVVYHLLSYTNNFRIRVKIAVDEDTPVASAVGVYPTAGWFEREVWDMFGVMFSGHPDLRRILTDYGFQGHPLRKDFPLTGYVELRYSEEQKRVIYEPVQLTQDFRSFDFMSPWEGAKYILPGDEKAGGDEDA